MELLDFEELGAAIRRVYVESDKYQLSKDVPTFEMNGKYVGDFFNFTMFEPDGDNPPIFYHIYSPYDIISGKSTQQAVVLRSGELIMSTDFTQYMKQRTGVMTSLILKGLNVSDLSKKAVVFVGVGNIAQSDLAALKSHYPDLKKVSYISRSGKAEAFVKLALDSGVEAHPSNLEHIGEFDILIFHTNSKVPVLTSAMRGSIKAGAIITTFSSEDSTEVASEFFDTKLANVLIDWEQTIDEAPELKSATENGLAKRSDVITLGELFTMDTIDESKQYTVYRSHGTPMQNLAAMQILLNRRPTAR